MKQLFVLGGQLSDDFRQLRSERVFNRVDRHFGRLLEDSPTVATTRYLGSVGGCMAKNKNLAFMVMAGMLLAAVSALAT